MGKELLGSLELNRIYQMDCLEGMKLIPDKSIDMILCDPPYGTTQCKWDSIIPLNAMWEQYERVIKDGGNIVVFGTQPFSSLLITGNLKMFKYSVVWNKKNTGSPVVAKKRPLPIHEDIHVFGKGKCTYNPIKTNLEQKRKWKQYKNSESIPIANPSEGETEGLYPKSIFEYSNADRKNKVHPTQKPVELFEYLIKLYSNENEIILDNCMGSGTTAIAATLANRNYIGFETESKYIEIANKRLDSIDLSVDMAKFET